MTPTEPLAPLLELASDPMGLVDDQGVVRYANTGLRAQFADAVGRPWSQISGTDATPQRAPAPDRPGWHICRLPDPDKALLQTRSEVLAALVDAAPVAILALDLDKRITMWNPACERMFGWTAEEIIGEPYPLVPPDEWDRFAEFFATVIGGQGFTGVEGLRRGKNGGVHVAISTAPIRDRHGEVTHAMAILEDISTRKQLEERYRQAQKMEAVGRLAGGIAHDFNNVLTVILAYTDALLVARDPNRMLSDVGAIQRAAERAADLTRQLLAFGRRQVLKAKRVDLNQTVSQSVDMLRRLIGEDVTIELDLASDLGPVRADPAQLERLLMNLAANARDAMPTGGRFQLTTGRVPHSAHPSLGEGNWICLTVRDSGAGMDEETIAHLFEPFFTTKELGRGTGLGLASVYGIVRQSGGQVDVKSVPGEGTAFQIYLPEAAGKVDQPEPDADVDQTLGDGSRVLVAEDDPQVREVIERALASRGFNVRAAASGAEALSLAAAWNADIDLLVTDVVMPGMSGRELATELLRLRPETRVLFVSGYTDDELLRRGIERGAAFLHKPFTTSSLLDAIRLLLES